MAWARLDDGWHDHPKTIAAGLDGAGLWAMCLTWAHANRRGATQPGFVPKGVVTRFAGAKASRVARKLVEVGLFDSADGGWLIHDFTDYLPRYDPAQAAEAGRKGAGKRWSTGRRGPAPEPPQDDEPPPEDDGEPLHEPPSQPPNGSPANRMAVASRTDGTRASARRNPDPVPEPVVLTKGEYLAYANAPARALAAEIVDTDRRPPLPSRPSTSDADRGGEPRPERRAPDESAARPGMTPTIAEAITAAYAAGVPLGNHDRALATIVRALGAGYDPDLVRRGVGVLIAEQRGCTPDQLRIAMLGADGNWRPGGGAAVTSSGPRPSTTDQRVAAALELANRLGDNPDPPQLRALPGGAA